MTLLSQRARKDEGGAVPRYLGALLEIGLIVFCLIEAIQAPDGRVRNLPKWAWILLILFIPYAGESVVYRQAGNSQLAYDFAQALVNIEHLILTGVRHD